MIFIVIPRPAIYSIAIDMFLMHMGASEVFSLEHNIFCFALLHPRNEAKRANQVQRILHPVLFVSSPL